jgi:hypothetical protein
MQEARATPGCHHRSTEQPAVSLQATAKRLERVAGSPSDHVPSFSQADESGCPVHVARCEAPNAPPVLRYGSRHAAERCLDKMTA